MSMSRKPLLAAVLVLAAIGAQAQERFPGIGRAATPAEVKAWDIDVRPDFQGLPKGSGSVAKGQDVWEARCASCHGVFGESNEVFNPLVGGTTEEDIRTGRVANLTRNDYPGRTTLMKVSTVSTLWDYINRAMPWNQPKSLSVDEVYAVTAYMLNLGRIVPDDFVLSDANIDQVQKRMPNRNGMTTAHAMWPGRQPAGAAKPDVLAQACMKDCPVEGKLTSQLPAFARNAHGNLAEQNRLVGAQRGVDTTRAEGGAPAQGMAPSAATKVAAAGPSQMPVDLLQKNSCTACHAPDRKLVGPSWNDVAKKHAGKTDYIAGKIRTGGSGTWGQIPMPPQTISADDAGRIAQWLAGGAAP
ncbi:c-type cytochrome [Ramlibacter sp. USB13]|uniref:C-type cytochrome n=1 Tax=Ramlibacter cellulosilyticus TaxID=2764187 RepID=A0A923MRF9_9BURK|nr:c-type cytochrome [Ramlibacter cellulosilyticus]MBC5783848.1 c-type cytochrome [Ramlibacter cellulosilyticus]